MRRVDAYDGEVHQRKVELMEYKLSDLFDYCTLEE